jgi:hypothetical protein
MMKAVMKSVSAVAVLGLLSIAACPGWAATLDVYDQDMLGTTYVDAYANSNADYNTWASNEITYATLDSWSVLGAGTTTKWGRNNTSSNPINNTDLEGKDLATPLPELTMTVSGLDSAKTYDIYAVYWAKNPALVTAYWYTYAKLEGEGAMLTCSYATATNIFYNNTVNPVGTNGCEKLLGTVSGVTSVNVLVAPPDYSSTLDQRARFDGVSYAVVVPEPAALVLVLGLGAMLGLRRWKK